MFGAGDVIGRNLFVYIAAYERSFAAGNALSSGGLISIDYTPIPWVVFTDPQVDFIEKFLLVLSNYCAIIIRKIVGVQVVATEGSELLMEVSLAIRFGAMSNDLAELLHLYLTHSEAIKMAAIGFDHDGVPDCSDQCPHEHSLSVPSTCDCYPVIFCQPCLVSLNFTNCTELDRV